jgi:hypothetical protein
MGEFRSKNFLVLLHCRASAGGRTDGCTGWSPSDQIIAMEKDDPTTLSGVVRGTNERSSPKSGRRLAGFMSIGYKMQRHPDRQNLSGRCPRACLVLIESWISDHDYLNAFKRALLEANIEAEIVTMPFFKIEDLTPDKLKDIKLAIRRRKDRGQFVIFFPGTEEIFLKDPDWSFVCSHYKSWYGRKFEVIPHVWSQIRTPSSITPFEWTDKPAFRIGFMGNALSDHPRMRKVVSKLPLSVKKWLLRGHHLKFRGALALVNQLGLGLLLKHINTFPRWETLKMLNMKKDVVEKGSIEIVDARFTGSEQEKDRYIRHLEAMTYVVCPRGLENFSFRVFEALRYGRIPVIIDTDMVLPTEVDWNQVAIRIPYDRLNDVYDIILNDYCSRSAEEFLARQRAAFSTMSELESMRWLTSRLRDVLTGT